MSKYGIGNSVDEDYIDVESKRADVSVASDSSESDVSYVFDDGSGNGAASDTEELIDGNAIIENDGRSETRTFFYVAEAGAANRQQYQRLIKWQDGMFHDERRGKTKKADMRRWVDAMATQLDMSPYHKERVELVCQSINMKHMAHYSTEKVILAIISLVANEDNRFIRDEDGFRDLMEDIDSDLGEIRRVRTLTRNKSDML